MPELIDRHALLKKVYDNPPEKARMTQGEWCRKCIEDERIFGFEREPRPSEFSMSVDDVMIGCGTSRGFVYLTEDLIVERGADNG